MPALDPDCLTVFLREFARCYAESLNVIVLDGAPAHSARAVVVPENVVLLFLPASCPELNPVERLWLFVRQQIDVFDEAVRSRLGALREQVAEILRGLTPEQVASLTGYDYIIQATHAL